MIVLDTSFLVDALTDTTAESHGELRRAIDRGQRLLMPTLVLYEWLCGPRTSVELGMQEAILPAAGALPFTEHEAKVAARLYAAVSRPRDREVDLAIAATALTRDAHLWTLNTKDFSDIPGLKLVTAG